MNRCRLTKIPIFLDEWNINKRTLNYYYIDINIAIHHIYDSIGAIFRSEFYIRIAFFHTIKTMIFSTQNKLYCFVKT